MGEFKIGAWINPNQYNKSKNQNPGPYKSNAGYNGPIKVVTTTTAQKPGKQSNTQGKQSNKGKSSNNKGKQSNKGKSSNNSKTTYTNTTNTLDANTLAMEALNKEGIGNEYQKLYERGINDPREGLGAENSSHTGNLEFFIPRYGVNDFINERALWQKGIHNLAGEPGWFYFKLFFNFQDYKGLFGGIMTNTIPNTSAIRYLYSIRNFYQSSKIQDRMLALARFTFTLSYINSISPWFFSGINGLNKLNGVNFLNQSKDNMIEIICNNEAIDMRLNTLLDMYKYACYDEINMKEVIPENLRKFDMSILIMNVPIKYFQTGMMISGNMANMGTNNKSIVNKVLNFFNGSTPTTFEYKTTGGLNNNTDNALSFQLYTLKNCEIDVSSFENYISSGLNNNTFFKLGQGSIKIKYDRYYKHTNNEWNSMMYGTTGFYYDNNAYTLSSKSGNFLSGIEGKRYKTSNTTNNHEQRLLAISNSIYNSFFDKNTTVYKGLIDFSESVIQDSLINVNDPNYLGNIGKNTDAKTYGDWWDQTKEKVKSFFRF